MRAYGNWCGPGWTAGQHKDSNQLTDADRQVPAIDALDQACKNHDIALHDYPEHADEINNEFVNEVKDMGVTGALFALAVQVAGPSPVSNLQDTSNMGRNALRRNEDEYRKQVEDRNEEDLRRQAMSLEDHTVGDYIETPIRVRSKSQKISPEDKPMSAARRFPWKELAALEHSHNTTQHNIPTRAHMDTNDATMQSKAATASSTIETRGQETQITKAQPTFYESHTLTKYAPYNYYFTIARPTFVEPLQVAIHLTTPQSMLTFTPTLAIPTPATNTTKGIWTHNLGHNRSAWENPLITYPRQITSLPALPQLPAGIRFYMGRYKKYTVLNCHYKITIQHINTNTKDNDIMMTYGYNTYTATTMGNKFPLNATTNVDDEMYWKDIKSAIIRCRSGDSSDQPNAFILEGNYKQGQAKKLVENDKDVEIWHNIETSGPTTSFQAPPLTEELVLRFYKAPLSPDSQLSTARIHVNLVYTIQFKDLVSEFEYPQNSDTAVASLIVDNADFSAFV